MRATRRQFIHNGVAAFTVGLAAPAFLSDLARAQGNTRRNLVVLYLSGGNDALSMLVPYQDPQYYARRPTLAVAPGNVLQIGRDAAGRSLGLHFRLTGLRSIFNDGRLAIIQRTGYTNSSRSHFLGTDIWSTAIPSSPSGTGWLGRYLDTLPAPVDALAAWNTVGEMPRTLVSRTVSVPSIAVPQQYAFANPNGGTDALFARQSAQVIASHVPVDQPHLAFVNGTARAAFATLDRVAQVAGYRPAVTYPTTGIGQALRAVAGAMAFGVGTRVFWVQTGGYDTHALQRPNLANGSYANLMTGLDGALAAFYADLRGQGLFGDTLLVMFSEFGRRIIENGSEGTDHGAAGLMFAMGGAVRGGLYGTSATLGATPDNPTLENNGNDVRHETDFRAVYATVIDQWLGGDSVAILGGNYRGGPAFV